jgi:hypothetical protein
VSNPKSPLVSALYNYQASIEPIRRKETQENTSGGSA